jgi:demethylmenaquinone methyltransferase/2-methoxy-6-polyprenyl-1,4-benzoquinol methylase
MHVAGAGERPRTPQAIFDRVAPYYDALNSVLSLGMDRRWRKQATRALGLRSGARVLDVATGTGALAAEIVRSSAGSVSVTGCDVNERMLSIARRRAARRRCAHVEFVRCDAASLPFGPATFDAVTIAFAIDDMPDRDACIREMARVLRPGGTIALLELGQPDARPVRAAYRLYLRTFHVVGRMAASGYRHLEQEILTYRGARAVEELLLRGGFSRYRRRSLTWGIARLHVAEKDGGAPS